jgi:hypothetical protein
MSDLSDGTVTVPVRRQARRLSDKILVAFHQACDQQDFEVAGRLLGVLETMTAALRLSRAPHGSERRRRQETLVAAHERLWQLRHPGCEPAT